MIDDKKTEREDMAWKGLEREREKKERTGPAAVCLAGIIFHQSLILSIKAVGLFFFFFFYHSLPPPLPFR